MLVIKPENNDKNRRIQKHTSKLNSLIIGHLQKKTSNNKNIDFFLRYFKYLDQGSPNYGPRAGSGSLTFFNRPTNRFLKLYYFNFQRKSK